MSGHSGQVTRSLYQSLRLHLFQLFYILFILHLCFFEKVHVFPLESLNVVLDYGLLCHVLARLLVFKVHRLRLRQLLEKMKGFVCFALEHNWVLTRSRVVMEDDEHEFLVLISSMESFAISVLRVVVWTRRIPRNFDQTIRLQEYHLHFLQVLLEFLK